MEYRNFLFGLDKQQTGTGGGMRKKRSRIKKMNITLRVSAASGRRKRFIDLNLRETGKPVLLTKISRRRKIILGCDRKQKTNAERYVERKFG
jgi:hypothetical protein